MKKINTMLAISFIAVSFLVGSVAGYLISPTYQQTMFSTQEMGLGKADKFVDLRYINSMVAHHRGAILLASQVVEKSHKEEIRTLAREILNGEPKLIQELYLWKKSMYNDGRKVQDPQVVNLGKVDEKFDLRFLNALIIHHEAGIDMTKDISTKSTRSEILNNANDVQDFLSQSLLMLKGWRSQLLDVN